MEKKENEISQEVTEGTWHLIYDKDGVAKGKIFVPEPTICPPDCPGCVPKMRLRRKKK